MYGTRESTQENAHLGRRLFAGARVSTLRLTRQPHQLARPRPTAWAKRILPVLLTFVCLAALAHFDGSISAAARQLPDSVIQIFSVITDYGKSAWVLVPFGLIVLVLAALPALPGPAGRVVASITARFGFLFAATAVPGLFTTTLKYLVGRTRPYAAAGDPFAFHPISFEAQYNGFPSGHSTTAFAAATAISLVWPRLGVVIPAWTYAVLIGASRVIVDAHFPTDVIASAALGVFGALLIRRYFAARGLVFAIRRDGSLRPFPGPSAHRLIRAGLSLFKRTNTEEQ